jgi:hypothetical protein
VRSRYCNSTLEPTLPRHAWTLNLEAVEGSEEDSYRFNPWRAPGRAPVVDACGQAGGEHGYQKLGGESVYFNTTNAKKARPPTDPGTLRHRALALMVPCSVRGRAGCLRLAVASHAQSGEAELGGGVVRRGGVGRALQPWRRMCALHRRARRRARVPRAPPRPPPRACMHVHVGIYGP